MKANLETIDLLRTRANVSYQAAKEALEYCDNDVVEALIYLEQKDKLKKNKKEKNKEVETQVKNFFEKLFEVRFVVTKKRKTLIDLPAVLILFVTLITLPFSLIFIVLGLVTGHKYDFINPGGKNVRVNDIIDDIQHGVKKETSSKEASSEEREEDVEEDIQE